MNWHTGFWRLTLVAWIVGSIAIVVVVGGVYDDLWQPFAEEHPGGAFRPCLESEALEMQRRAWLVVCPRFADADRAEYERALAQWESEMRYLISTPKYWRGLGLLLAILAGWGVGLWGLLYTMKWILGGFLGGSEEQ